MNKTLFVLGAPRSGTTLLVNFLATNQSKICGTAWESQFYMAFRRKPFTLDSFLKNRYFAHLLTAEEITDIFSRSKSHTDFFRNAIRLKLEQSGKQIFIEKSPTHTHYYKSIIKDFDNPEFIIINRNPYDCIQSIATTKWMTLPSDVFPKSIRSNKSIRYFFSAYIFYDYTRVANKISKHPLCILTLNYEDIILEKINVKELLDKALGIELDPLYVPRPYSNAVKHKENKLDRSRIGDYKNVMPKNVQRYIRAIYFPENFTDHLIRIPMIALFEFGHLFSRIFRKR